MSDVADGEIVSAWIALQYAKRGSAEYGEKFWAHMSFDEIVDSDAERSWKLINDVKNGDGSDFILSNLASGPVEDLLSRNGAAVIAKIEKDAEGDERLRHMLSFVWKNNIEDDVWNRVQKVIKS
jgi:hypothetical protein